MPEEVFVVTINGWFAKHTVGGTREEAVTKAILAYTSKIKNLSSNDLIHQRPNEKELSSIVVVSLQE